MASSRESHACRCCHLFPSLFCWPRCLSRRHLIGQHAADSAAAGLGEPHFFVLLSKLERYSAVYALAHTHATQPGQHSPEASRRGDAAGAVATLVCGRGPPTLGGGLEIVYYRYDTSMKTFER